MKYYYYIIRRDFGFAPNPFGKHCTLATCKADIRQNTPIGSWVIGMGSKTNKDYGKLVYMMRVDKKITFDEYWNDPEFQYKKAIFNGSLKQKFGDNIYHYDSTKQQWIQENSHHSLAKGVTNTRTFDSDLRSKYVLISEYFWYFGKNAPLIPTDLQDKIRNGRGYFKVDKEVFEKLFLWVTDLYTPGYHGDPKSFKTFKRYSGK